MKAPKCKKENHVVAQQLANYRSFLLDLGKRVDNMSHEELIELTGTELFKDMLKNVHNISSLLEAFDKRREEK